MVNLLTPVFFGGRLIDAGQTINLPPDFECKLVANGHAAWVQAPDRETEQEIEQEIEQELETEREPEPEQPMLGRPGRGNR